VSPAERRLRTSAEVLAPELLVAARALADEVFPGLHRSAKAGEGAEFSEFDEYRPGEDLRHLDWRRLARSEEAVVRRYESERRGRVLLVVDLSASMDFGGRSDRPFSSKAERARLLALALTLAHRALGDRVRLRLIGEGSAGVSPGGTGDDGAELAAQLTTTSAKGNGNIRSAILEEIQEFGQPFFVWILSDFLDQEGWESSLKGTQLERLDLRTILIADPLEVSFDFRDPARFEALEGDAHLYLDPVAVAEAYRAAFAAHRKDVAGVARSLGSAHIDHVTDEDPAVALQRWVREAEHR
jgi:uncharacterized protein (DUF58 family)